MPRVRETRRNWALVRAAASYAQRPENLRPSAKAIIFGTVQGYEVAYALTFSVHAPDVHAVIPDDLARCPQKSPDSRVAGVAEGGCRSRSEQSDPIEPFACFAHYQVAVMPFDHGEGRSSYARYVEGRHPVHQSLRNETALLWTARQARCSSSAH